MIISIKRWRKELKKISQNFIKAAGCCGIAGSLCSAGAL